MSPARPRSVPNLGPELEPRSRYSVRQQTDSGIAAVAAPRRGTPTQDFRGGAKPIALFSLQKTAKTASAPSHSHDSSGNDAPSLISIRYTGESRCPRQKWIPAPVPCQGRASPGKRGGDVELHQLNECTRYSSPHHSAEIRTCNAPARLSWSRGRSRGSAARWRSNLL